MTKVKPPVADHAGQEPILIIGTGSIASALGLSPTTMERYRILDTPGFPAVQPAPGGARITTRAKLEEWAAMYVPDPFAPPAPESSAGSES